MKLQRLLLSVSALVTGLCLSCGWVLAEDAEQTPDDKQTAKQEETGNVAKKNEIQQGKVVKSDALVRLTRPPLPSNSSARFQRLDSKFDPQKSLEPDAKLSASARENLLKAKVMEAAGMRPLSTKTSSNSYFITASELRALSQYDICVMIDASGSMSLKDCVSMKSFIIEEHVSRWDWCGEQSELLSQQISPAFPHGITVIPFATRAKRFSSVFPSTISDIFAECRPGGATRLDAALELELTSFYADKRFAIKRKPLLIAIISDGVPSTPGLVTRQIFDLSNSVKPEDIRIVFFLIGTAPTGNYFVNNLSHLKENSGAANNLVSARSFQSLCQVGLPRSLAQTVLSLDSK